MDGEGQREQRARRREQADPRQKAHAASHTVLQQGVPRPTQHRQQCEQVSGRHACPDCGLPLCNDQPGARQRQQHAYNLVSVDGFLARQKENSSTASGASAMISARLMAEVVTPAT